MCGRFILKSPADRIAEAMGVSDCPNLPPRFNIAPTQPVLVARLNQKMPAREFRIMQWGFIPAWAKDPAIGSRLINARADSLPNKPAFRAAFLRRRCLIPADGFYEWTAPPEGKQPFLFTMQDNSTFAFAGIWEHWLGSDGSEIESCAIITTDANPLVRPVHERMPVILKPASYTQWLSPADADMNALMKLLASYPASLMSAAPVSRRVNNPKNDDPSCLTPPGLNRENQ
ncbi:MAG: SOS response-associated peptidase [bacterium]